MDRKFKTKAWVTAGIMLFASGSALSAGLGKLTVMSTLGQPFRGEIELLAVDKKDLGSIKAQFAPLEAFRDANIERSASLSAMRFSVEQKKNGEPYLKISSSRPIDEPFLDMLVEIDWPSGRLVREYTVLLDPPGYGTALESVAPVAPPLAVTRSEPAAPAKAAERPVEASKPERAPTDKKPDVKKADGAATEPASADGKPAQETYGPVKQGENLSLIASSLKPEGVSLEQMLVALFQSNQQAFSGNNMNRLKTGQILRLPEPEQLEAVAKEGAAKQVRAHSADWHAYRQKLAAAVAEAKPVHEEAARPSASGKISTAVEDKGALAKEPSKDVLKLSRSEALGDAKAGGAGGKELQGMKAQLEALKDEATAKDNAIKEANQRIAELEKSIKEMQGLLTLKNQNLADMQKQAATAKPAPVVPAPAATLEEKPLPEKKEAASAAKPEVKPVQPKPKAVVVPPPQPELSLLDEMMQNPLYLGGSAVAALLLGLLGLRTVAARRNKNVASFEDSIMTSGDLKANTSLGGTGGGKIDTGDTSFLTDFSKAGLGSIDTNEVDPIAEAEVYMAYGRDAQAEEILKEAQAKDPNRHEIRLKLLEIYAARKNLNAFEAVAGEMYAALNGQASPVWDKAAEMGRTLDPDNPLYAENKAAAPAEPAYDKTMIVSGGMAGLIAAGEQDVMLDLGGPEIAEAASTDLDFNLDIVAPVEAASAPVAEAPVIEEEAAPVEPQPETSDLGFDFDLGTLGETPASAPVAEPEESTPPEAEAVEAVLDFDLDLGVPAEAKPEPAAEPAAAFDLAAESEPEPASAPELESVMEFDLGALTTAESEPVPASEPEISFEVAPPEEPPIEELPAELSGEQPEPAESMISAESWRDEVMSLDSGAEAVEGAALELPEFSVEEEAPAAAEMEDIELAAPPAEESPLDFDFNLAVEESAAPAPAAPAASMSPAHDLDLSDISLELDGQPAAAPLAADDFAGQEASTKLDLAKAYSDMGDKEGAREILQEVLNEGTEAQQNEARALIAELG